jgi:hypothetical protein
MQLHPIQRYIDERGEYQQGVDLFEKYGGNPFLLRTFRALENSYTRELLNEQLQKLIPQSAPVKEKFTIESSQEHAALPSQIKALNARKADLFKEMSHLHSLLTQYEIKESGTGHELKVKWRAFSTAREADDAASRILHLDNEINKIWEQLDHYSKTGKLPASEPVKLPSQDPVNLHQRLTNLRTYISRDPHNPKAELWKKEIETIINQLK